MTTKVELLATLRLDREMIDDAIYLPYLSSLVALRSEVSEPVRRWFAAGTSTLELDNGPPMVFTLPSGADLADLYANPDRRASAGLNLLRLAMRNAVLRPMRTSARFVKPTRASDGGLRRLRGGRSPESCGIRLAITSCSTSSTATARTEGSFIPMPLTSFRTGQSRCRTHFMERRSTAVTFPRNTHLSWLIS